MAQTVITCPECETRYKTDADSIGPNGRTVRCARCKATWFVPAVTDVRPDDLALQDSMTADAFPERIAPPAPIGPATAVPAAGPTADVVLRNQADAARLARRSRLIWTIWIVTMLIVLAGIVVAYLNRQAIVNRIPQTATLYQGLGIEVREGGLEIDPPVAKTSIVDGLPVIRVESAIRNLSSETLDVPLVALSLHDGTGAELVQWFVEPAEGRLSGKGRLPFTTEYADPPTEVTSLRYQFAKR